jgi:putative tricarboxylic transport membrane protein
VKKDICTCAFWLFLALYLTVASNKLGLGAGGRPGPGFFPFGAAIAIGIIAFIRLLRPRSETTMGTTSSGWHKIASVIAGMVAYTFLLEPLGFALCTFLLMAFYLRAVASQRWNLTVSFAFTIALLSHLFFDVLLNAPLPRGIVAALM